MRFNFSPPDCQCVINQFAFNAYAYRQQQIENFISALVLTNNPNDYSNQSTAALCANLNMSSLTADEIKYIQKEVVKRR